MTPNVVPNGSAGDDCQKARQASKAAFSGWKTFAGAAGTVWLDETRITQIVEICLKAEIEKKDQ